MNFFFSSRRRHTFFFQAEDGIRDRSPSRGLGDVYKRQELDDKIAGIKDKTKDMKDKKALFLLVNEGELSTFGAGERFGSMIFDLSLIHI